MLHCDSMYFRFDFVKTQSGRLLSSTIHFPAMLPGTLLTVAQEITNDYCGFH
jgi:hypothetical protein